MMTTTRKICLWFRYGVLWEFNEWLLVRAVRFVRSRMTYYRQEDIELYLDLKQWQEVRDHFAKRQARHVE